MPTYENIYTEGLLPIPRRLKIKTPQTKFLWKRYFGQVGKVVDQKYIPLRVQEYARDSAELASFGAGPNVHDSKIEWEEKLFPAPYMFDSEVLGIEDSMHVPFEEDPHNPLTPFQRSLMALAYKREELINRQETKTELLCHELLSTGKVKTINSEADFEINPSLLMAPEEGAKIGDTGVSAIKFLQQVLDDVWIASRAKPTEICMGRDVYRMIMFDDDFVKLMDNRRFNIGTQNFTSLSEDGIADYGFINLPDFGFIRLLSYQGETKVLNEAGTAYTRVPILPSSSLFAAYPNLGEMNYAALQGRTPEGIAVPIKGKEFVHVSKNDDVPAQFSVARQTHPLPAPIQKDTWRYVPNAVKTTT